MRTFGLAIALMLFADPALAFDCARAKSAAERAICSDPEARIADEALGKAYNRLRNSLVGEDAAELRHAQIEWIHSRDAACSTGDAKCLAEKSRERLRYLDGKPLDGDVSASLFRPMFISRPAQNGSAPLSIRAIKFTGDGVWQSRLNATIDSAVKRAISDAEAAKENPGSHDDYNVDLGVDLAYASSRMFSVHVDSGSFMGQAHPDYSNYNINFDRSSGRELTFDDLLDSARAKPIFEFCRSAVAKEKRGRPGVVDPDHWKDDVELEEVRESTKDLKFWSFNSSAAVIYYGAYAFGGYGQCMCTCTIPYSMLRPIAKKDFPLP